MARRERGIYKRKDGRFEARFIKGRDASGKAVYSAVYAQTYAEIKAKRDAAMEKLKLPEPIKAHEITVRAALEQYLESVKVQIKPSTAAIYKRYTDSYIVPFFGETTCDRLSQAQFQAFINKLVADGLSAITVQSVFSFLKSGVNSAMIGNVFNVNLPKYRATEVEVLSVDEQKRLESAAKSSDEIDFLTITLCLYTGIRVGEVCGLKWEDVDFERKVLKIRRTLQRMKVEGGESKTKLGFSTPKSKTSVRNIPLSEFLLTVLKEAKSESSSQFVLSRNGDPVEPRAIQTRFKKLLKQAELKDINFHVTRHTFAVRALESGFDIKSLSEILGHGSASVTLDKYAHALDDHKRELMESLTSSQN
jgi:integrase